ncbi:hypothetical protein VTL71DRAFT_8840 [Oculimacula yallundae]|uniref:Major facilitator superfamily (MFS) profile domain-containing protein n=1 Tax=Oculimacula yallundae TaxID=86028 RepID=A0ABR4BVP0_9HELO
MRVVILKAVDLTVLPLLLLGLLVFQLDRMNLASALTAGFARDIGINQTSVNLGNQLMFIGIIILEIPSNMLLQKIGPRIYIAAQVLVFGLIATLQCVVTNRTGFLIVKSLLGLAEAGYIPGGIFTISTWYTQKERAKRVAIFFFGMFGGNAISPLLASGIIKLDGKRGLRGWQWIFLLEGVFTIAVALLILLFLPGSPEHPEPIFSKGLIKISASEGEILQKRIASEFPQRIYKSQHMKITLYVVWKTVSNWRRWPHFIATSLIFSTWSPLTTYTPSIIMSLGFSSVEANALASVGAFLVLPIVFIFAAISDRTNKRGLTVFLAIIYYLITLVVIRSTEARVGKWGRWGLWTAVNTFAVGYQPVHNTWLQLNCESPEERSVAIALFVMSSITGLMYGTQYFQANDRPLYHNGLETMIGVVSAGAALVLVQEFIYWKWNRKAIETAAPDNEDANSGNGKHGMFIPRKRQ